MAEEETPKSNPHHHPTSTSDLFSGAKTLADAAQSAFARDTDKIDKAKVAGAAEDLLEAAKKYGKLEDDKGVGQYVEKAETYLHQYHSSGSAASAAVDSGEKEHPSGGGGGGGGDGQYVEKAESFLHQYNSAAKSGGDSGEKEHSSGGGGGGAGDFIKMAQGFLK